MWWRGEVAVPSSPGKCVCDGSRVVRLKGRELQTPGSSQIWIWCFQISSLANQRKKGRPESSLSLSVCNRPACVLPTWSPAASTCQTAHGILTVTHSPLMLLAPRSWWAWKVASCTEVGQPGWPSSTWEVEGTTESSGAGHLALSLLGARAVPSLEWAWRSWLGNTGKEKGEKGAVGMVVASGWKAMPETEERVERRKERRSRGEETNL